MMPGGPTPGFSCRYGIHAPTESAVYRRCCSAATTSDRQALLAQRLWSCGSRADPADPPEIGSRLLQIEAPGRPTALSQQHRRAASRRGRLQVMNLCTPRHLPSMTRTGDATRPLFPWKGGLFACPGRLCASSEGSRCLAPVPGSTGTRPTSTQRLRTSTRRRKHVTDTAKRRTRLRS